MTFRIETTDDQISRELDRLAAGPGADGTTFRFEAIFLSAYAATQGQVHVLTGLLKSTGHPTTSYNGSVWTGEVGYVRHPGIFELARGNRPTQNHPEGGHFFLSAMYDTHDPMERAISDYMRGERR